MDRRALAFTSLLALSCGGTELDSAEEVESPAVAAGPYATTPRWRLTFKDEFDGPTSPEEDARCFSGRTPKCAYGANDGARDCRPEDVHPGLAKLNRCNWTVLSDYSFWSNHTAEFEPDQVRVENGELILSARKDAAAPHDCGTPLPDAPWLFTSKCPYAIGGVIGKRYTDAGQPGFVQKYGRFEVRGRVSSGPGSFPAYWMLPQEGGWPDAGEIDIMEYVDSKPWEAVFTLHGRDGRWHSGWGTWFKPAPAFTRMIVDEYHTWAVEWRPGEVVAFLDNREIRRTTSGQAIDDVWDSDTCRIPTPESAPFFFILNDGITNFGGGAPSWSSFWHREGHIDYVRAYGECATAADYCPSGGTFDGASTCRGTGVRPYASPCVESTLSASCPNPCQGVGRFDGYNCWLRNAPDRMKLYEKDGHFRYRRKIGVTLRGDCRSGDAFLGVFEGCDAGAIPPGRASFEYGSNFYVTATCSTTENPPLCANPCPYGGSFDGRNCHVVQAPAGTIPFVWERRFYYRAVRGDPRGPCPYQPAPYTATFDGANCLVNIPVPLAANPFVYDRRYYLQACGGSQDWQRIPASSVGTTYDEPSCAPL